MYCNITPKVPSHNRFIEHNDFSIAFKFIVIYNKTLNRKEDLEDYNKVERKIISVNIELPTN